jgi:hypothetical protein
MPSPRRRPWSYYSLFLDFQNVLKSFIGSNYLVMPFAYTQGGLLLGTVALVFVGLLTDRCCSQLIACKRRVVADMLLARQQQSSRGAERKFAATTTTTAAPPSSSPSSSAAAENPLLEEALLPPSAPATTTNAPSGEEEEESSSAEALHARISYGETAREAFGGSPTAEAVVEGALAFTQLGFCVEYFIFVVAALRAFFPAVAPAALAAVPFAFLAPCALLPSVKALAPISAVANAAILAGFAAILAYELRRLPLCCGAAAAALYVSDVLKIVLGPERNERQPSYPPPE